MTKYQNEQNLIAWLKPQRSQRLSTHQIKLNSKTKEVLLNLNKSKFGKMQKTQQLKKQKTSHNSSHNSLTFDRKETKNNQASHKTTHKHQGQHYQHHKHHRSGHRQKQRKNIIAHQKEEELSTSSQDMTTEEEIIERQEEGDETTIKVYGILVWIFGAGVLAQLFGPKAWRFIHLFTSLTKAGWRVQKEFTRLIHIMLPCISCYQNLLGYLRQHRVQQNFSIKVRQWKRKTGKSNAYLQRLWIKIHNHANLATGKPFLQTNQALKLIKTTDQAIFESILSLITFLELCAQYQLSPNTRVEYRPYDNAVTLTNEQNKMWTFRQLLPLVQFIAFLQNSDFLASIDNAAVQKFLELLKESKLSNPKIYYPRKNNKSSLSSNYNPRLFLYETYLIKEKLKLWESGKREQELSKNVDATE